MLESNLMRTIQLAIGKLVNVRLFRNNTGTGWVGQRVAEWKAGGEDFVTLKNPRPLRAGLCLGSSDLIGLTCVIITPEMIGKQVAIFTALEVKTETGRVSKEQKAFLEMVKKFGGLAGTPRNAAEAVNLLNGTLTERL